MLKSKVPNEKKEDEFLDQTIAIWGRFTTRDLSREDARQIAEAVVGFFEVLKAWEKGGVKKNSS